MAGLKKLKAQKMLFSYSQSPLNADDLSEVRSYIHYLYTVEDPHEAQDIFLDLIQSPGRLDQLLAQQSEGLQEDLEKILQNPSESFLNRLFNIVWDKRSSNIEIFNPISTRWLLNLAGIKQFGFIRFDKTNKIRPTSGAEHRLREMYRNEDDNFIYLARLANQKLETASGWRPLYLALANLNCYNSEPISYALTLALKNSHFYANLEDYYLNSSEAFKQSPKVKSAMQLRYCFGYTSKIQSLNDDGIIDITSRHNNRNHLKTNKNKLNDDYGVNYNLDYYEVIFSHNLIKYHLDDLFAMGLALSQLSFSGSRTPEPHEEALYQRARGIYQRIAQLLKEVSAPLMQDNRLAVYSLALLTLKYERIANPTHTQSNVMTELKSGMRSMKKVVISFSTLGALAGKDLEIPFLRFLIKHLVEFGECASKNTSEPDAPFIWNAFKACCLKASDRYSPIKMSAVNVWLQKIFKADTALTLNSLPKSLFADIFAGSEKTTCDLSQAQLDTESIDEEASSATLTELEEVDSEDDEPPITPGVLTKNPSAQFQAQEYQKAFSRHLERSGSSSLTFK